tara:strand:- start:345 stop:683 length:339 start_codon:yes stop_codon:yes gene_type:complete
VVEKRKTVVASKNRDAPTRSSRTFVDVYVYVPFARYSCISSGRFQKILKHLFVVVVVVIKGLKIVVVFLSVASKTPPRGKTSSFAGVISRIQRRSSSVVAVLARGTARRRRT